VAGQGQRCGPCAHAGDQSSRPSPSVRACLSACVINPCIRARV
jgi:hypothetical protein